MHLINRNNKKEMEYLVENVRKSIYIALVQSGISKDSTRILAAYLLCKASLYNNPTGVKLDNLLAKCDEEVLLYTKENITDEAWERLLPLTETYPPAAFAAAAVIPFEESDDRTVMPTPKTLTKLVHHILDIHEEDCVADICCGRGNYLIDAALEYPDAKYIGFDLNVENRLISMLKAELISADIDVELCDVFTLSDNEQKEKFDKIFSNYPFGLKIKTLGAGMEFLEEFCEQYPGLSKATSSDWVFNALICSLLKADGRAVAVMTNGSTWNTIDEPIRKHFVENGLIEAVVSLPERLFGYTNIPTTLIVFSHNNSEIRMIDATKQCEKGRRQNYFSEENISTIVDGFNTDSEISRIVSLSEVRDNEYNLSLGRYTEEKISFENGVPFESVIKSITRGAPCTASQLDKMASAKATNMQYLMLANIKDGMIDEKLPYLSQIEDKLQKYCLNNRNLILSKNGYPYKVAVATVKEGQQILANGNLYVIELDEEKVNPYYLKAFFDSEQGIATLKSITVGATIPNIGVDKLKKVEIPLPGMDEQLRLAEKYQATLDEIAVIKLRLEKAMNKLKHVFDEERE